MRYRDERSSWRELKQGKKNELNSELERSVFVAEKGGRKRRDRQLDEGAGCGLTVKVA